MLNVYEFCFFSSQSCDFSTPGGEDQITGWFRRREESWPGKRKKWEIEIHGQRKGRRGELKVGKTILIVRSVQQRKALCAWRGAGRGWRTICQRWFCEDSALARTLIYSLSKLLEMAVLVWPYDGTGCQGKWDTIPGPGSFQSRE